jgi:hypothetical protein
MFYARIIVVCIYITEQLKYIPINKRVDYHIYKYRIRHIYEHTVLKCNKHI